MLIKSIEIKNFRSIVESGTIPLSDINVFTGPNNVGKSSVLLALYQFQQGYGPKNSDVRVGTQESNISLFIENPAFLEWLKPFGYLTPSQLTLSLTSGGGNSVLMRTTSPNGHANVNISFASNIEPNHFVIPYLSKRKTGGYTEDVRLEHAMRVAPTLSFLPAKLSRISHPGYPSHDLYRKKCEEILGFFVASIPSQNGQCAGIYLPDGKSISIESMGEGVPNIVSLLVDLVSARGKVFLIEEPENDLHPQALKALLELIVESSAHNQFFISTHSNIVVRYLAATENSRLFSISSEFGRLPTVAEIREVPPSIEARLALLRELGYSFSDFDLWDGWLILEESSAERIIRDYLIPWFAPKLSRIRTLSAGGADKVNPVFEDYDRLVRFTHLEHAYRNSAWVLVDGDEKGREVIQRLQANYPTWEPDRFGHLSNTQFEHYYPREFSEAVTKTIAIRDKKELREGKKILLNNVRQWLDEDRDRGQTALAESAAEVISYLRTIESKLLV